MLDFYKAAGLKGEAVGNLWQFVLLVAEKKVVVTSRSHSFSHEAKL